MNLKGKMVYHYNLDGIPNNPGTIVDADDISIWVKFKNRAPVRFSFPDAFVETSTTKKYLWTENVEISNLIKQQYCADCGTKFTGAPIIIDGHRLCRECASKWKACSKCQRLVRKHDLIHLYWEKVDLCNKCITRDHFKCAECEEWCPNDELAEGIYFPENRQYCVNCALDALDFFCCAGCGNYFPEDLGHSFDGNYYDVYCPECFTKFSSKCKKCGKAILSKNGALCARCKTQVTYIKQFSDPSLFSGVVETVDVDGRLLRDWKTIQIMSQLNHTTSDPIDILILKNYSTIYKTAGAIEISLPLALDLVIIDEAKNTSLYRSGYGCTATELKTNRCGNIRNYLCDTIFKKPLSIVSLTDTSCFFLMDGAYGLRAVTFGDMDYGKEWNGYHNYIEHNNYGDTSNFNIIGGIVRISTSTECLKWILKRINVDINHFRLIDFVK